MTDPVVVVPKTPLTVTVAPSAGSPVYIGPAPVGPAGPQGPQGPQGYGVAPGGEDGEVVTKTGTTDYVVGWSSLTEFVVIDKNGSVPPETPVGAIVLARSL